MGKSKVEKVRKMFLDDLPRYKEGRFKGKINWISCVGIFVKFIYDDIIGEIEIIKYDGSYLYIQYENKELFKIGTDKFRACRLGRLLGVYTGNFKFEIESNILDEKRNITIVDTEYRIYKNNNQNKKWYKYKCNRCNYDGWIEESCLIRGNGCAVCCINPRVAVLGINTIWDTDRWMCDLGVSEKDAKKYTKSSSKKVEIICPDCGRIKPKKISLNNIYKNRSIGCNCGDGIKYPEKFVFNILEQINIDFKPQLTKTTFKWCKDYRYDFYFELNNDHYIIETHGRQHYQYTGMRRTPEQEQENDRLKKELALKNGIKEKSYIEIDCRKSEMEWIRGKILKSKLNELFDLRKIDWLKCEEFALSNRVKEACEYKKNNPDLTATQISEIMKLEVSTIRRYLKSGYELEWINYNKKKQVEILKNNISLGVFKSCTEIERVSEIIFGVKLFNQNISAVCTGKHLMYKGFTFKYIYK